MHLYAIGKNVIFQRPIAVFLLLLPSSMLLPGTTDSYAEIIPPSRRIIWNPGVEGGIPYYPLGVNVKDYGATGDGNTDDTQAIRNAINACPLNKAVYFPSGTYRVTANIAIEKSIVLRGDGPSQTSIKSTAAGGDIITFNDVGGSRSNPYISISSGYTKDSTTLTLSTTSGLSIGDTIYVTQTDSGIVSPQGNYLCNFCGPDETPSTHCMGQLVKITQIAGNTITLSRPMYLTYSSANNPVVKEFSGMLSDAGIEHMKVFRTAGTDGTNIEFRFSYNCWMRNVESANSGRYHVLLAFSHNCTIQDSYIHHAAQSNGYGSDHAYGIHVFWSNSDHLIENNILYYLRHGIIFAGGGSGCVIGYNYSKDPYDSDYPTSGTQDLSYHGSHPYMNLWEGNIGFQIAPDNTFGSNSHSTYFRNWVTGLRTMTTTWLNILCDIEAKSTYHNFVGNALGYSGMMGWTYETNNCSVNKAVWKWGCWNQSGSNTNRSDTPRNTALRHGNYDYVQNRTTWDATITDQILPASYYLASKPSFFGNRPWPAIGPDLPLIVGSLPAEDRFEGSSNAPAAPTNLRIIP